MRPRVSLGLKIRPCWIRVDDNTAGKCARKTSGGRGIGGEVRTSSNGGFDEGVKLLVSADGKL